MNCCLLPHYTVYTVEKMYLHSGYLSCDIQLSITLGPEDWHSNEEHVTLKDVLIAFSKPYFHAYDMF